VQVDDPALHRMHSERYSIPQETLSKIANALLHRDPIVFVGTTTFRAVESFLLQGLELENSRSGQESASVPGLGHVILTERLFSSYQSLAEQWLETDLFVRPASDPHRADPSIGNKGLFRCYAPMIGNGMITNFHQPKSTLLMLVSALCGVDFIKSVYQHALGSGYRFLSYGDASLIGFGASPRLVVPDDQSIGVQDPGAEVKW
jgi:S-adenosylmethionine:tRNA ribosyltransferase-isomerase